MGWLYTTICILDRLLDSSHLIEIAVVASTQGIRTFAHEERLKNMDDGTKALGFLCTWVMLSAFLFQAPVN